MDCELGIYSEKTIKNIEDLPLYAVTNDGRIWSYISQQWLKLIEHKGGYLKIA